MKKSGLIIVGMALLSGCTLVKNKPIEPLPSLESNITKVEEPLPVIVKEEPTEVIENLFASATGNDPTTLIESLDAYAWEKEALNKAYRSYNQIWNPLQKEEFKKILDEDSYLSICSDKRYVENLEHTENKNQEDILYSITLLRYLNNLKGSCVEWVTSDGQVEDENREEHIRANYLLSMLPEGVFISKLFLPYYPKDTAFLSAVNRYKIMSKTQSASELREERLDVEKLKQFELHPDYN